MSASDLGLSENAAVVLRERYLLRDTDGKVIESPRQMMERVAAAVASAEDEFERGSAPEWEERFAELLTNLAFLPNSPTLMNAGTPVGTLSACFVLPVEDSLRSIFDTLGDAALIHQAGGGTGFAFSHLRPRGDPLVTTGGESSGPVSFLELFDTATRVIQQTGRRRGANMAVLDVSHPDIEEFVTAKEALSTLPTFNLSVGVTDRFMHAVREDGAHELVNPRTGRTVGSLPARRLFELICAQAWRSGDPGLLFLDAINASNPLPELGPIDSTNPCGEVPLRPYESCTLGSINLAAFLADQDIRWEELGAAVRLAIRFLDDVVEINRYPTAKLEEAALATRKIGLGVMGLADVLATLRLPYNSSDALALTARIMAEVERASDEASAQLASERGPFPLFGHSVLARTGSLPLRNAQRRSVAPTGTISMIAGVTSSIEPMFAVAYERHVLDRRLIEVNPVFERTAREHGFYSRELIEEISATGSVSENPSVPPDLRPIFLTALDLAPQDHLQMQALVQRHVDAAVSKTVNLPSTTTPRDVESVYLAAAELGVKGITIYRDGSRPEQVLRSAPHDERVRASEDFSGGCSWRTCTF